MPLSMIRTWPVNNANWTLNFMANATLPWPVRPAGSSSGSGSGSGGFGSVASSGSYAFVADALSDPAMSLISPVMTSPFTINFPAVSMSAMVMGNNMPMTKLPFMFAASPMIAYNATGFDASAMVTFRLRSPVSNAVYTVSQQGGVAVMATGSASISLAGVPVGVYNVIAEGASSTLVGWWAAVGQLEVIPAVTFTAPRATITIPSGSWLNVSWTVSGNSDCSSTAAVTLWAADMSSNVILGSAVPLCSAANPDMGMVAYMNTQAMTITGFVRLRITSGVGLNAVYESVGASVTLQASSVVPSTSPAPLSISIVNPVPRATITAGAPLMVSWLGTGFNCADPKTGGTGVMPILKLDAVEMQLLQMPAPACGPASPTMNMVNVTVPAFFNNMPLPEGGNYSLVLRTVPRDVQARPMVPLMMVNPNANAPEGTFNGMSLIANSPTPFSSIMAGQSMDISWNTVGLMCGMNIAGGASMVTIMLSRASLVDSSGKSTWNVTLNADMAFACPTADSTNGMATVTFPGDLVPANDYIMYVGVTGGVGFVGKVVVFARIAPLALSPPSFTITELRPRLSGGNVVVAAGDAVTVFWTFAGMPPSEAVSITLASSVNGMAIPYASSNAGAGSASFTIPPDSAPGNTYYVGIVSQSRAAVKAQFPNAVTVLSPATIGTPMLWDARTMSRIVDVVPTGSSVRVAWMTSLAPSVVQDVSICRGSAPPMCRRLARVLTPTNWTVVDVPLDMQTSASADTSIRVNATTAVGRMVFAASANFALTDGSAMFASVRMTSPLALVQTAMDMPLNITWASTGLAANAMVIVDFLPAGMAAGSMAMPILNWTWPVTGIAGGCSGSSMCMGAAFWRVLPPVVMPPGANMTTIVACVRSAGADPSARSCSAPIYVMRAAPPRLDSIWLGGLTQGPNGGQIFTLGSALSVRWMAAALGANAMVSVTLMSNNPDVTPFTVSASVSAYAGAVSMVIPANAWASIPAGALFFVRVATVSADGVMMMMADSPMLAVVPAGGVLSIRFPASGTVITTGSPFSVAWAAMGISANVDVMVVDANMPSVILSSMNSVPASAGMASMPAIADNKFAAMSLMAMAIVRLPAMSWMSGNFTISKPSMTITNVMLQAAASFAIGSSVMVSWSSMGFPAGAAARFALVNPSTNMMIAPIPAQASVSSGMVTLTVPASLMVGWSYKIAVGAVDYPIMPAMSPNFTVTPPRAGLIVRPVMTATNDVPRLGSDVMFGWSTIDTEGKAIMNANTVNVTLENSALPAWRWWVRAGTGVATEASVTVRLPFNLPTDGGVASSYFFRVIYMSADGASRMMAMTPAFTVAPPRYYIAVSSPVAGTAVKPGDSISVMFDANSLVSPTAGVAARVNITLRNAVDRSEWVLPQSLQDASAGTNGVSILITAAMKASAGAERSFFFAVRSVDFPAIGAASSLFSIVQADAPARLWVTGIAASASADDAVLGGAIFNRSDAPTLRWMSENPSGLLVNIALRNARTGEMKVVTPAGGVPAANNNFTVARGALDVPSAQDATLRDAFYFEVMPVDASKTGLASRSGLFSIFAARAGSIVTAAVRLLAPAAPATRAVGEFIDVQWASVGLDATATIAIDLMNDIIGAAGTKSLRARASAAGTLSFQIPADVDLTTGGDVARKAWYVRAAASATVFAVSPPLALLPPPSAGVRVMIASPVAGMQIIVGQMLNVKWGISVSGGATYLADIALMNDQITDGSLPSLGKKIEPTSGSFAWVVPAAIRTDRAVASSYYVQITLRPDSGPSVTFTSPLFTISAAESSVRVLTPLQGDMVTAGSSIKVTWSARNARGPYDVMLVNSASGFRWFAGRVNGSMPDATGVSSGWWEGMIPADVPASAAVRDAWVAVVVPVAMPAAAGKAGPFSIAPLAQAYTILAPAAGVVANNGSQVRYAFTLSADAASSDSASRVDIWLRNARSAIAIRLAAGVTATSGVLSLPGALPVDLLTRGSYFIRIAPAGTGSGFAPVDSDWFTITAAANVIKVMAPAPASIFTRGDRLLVSWAATSTLQGSVRVELVNALARTSLTIGAASAVDPTGACTMPDASMAAPSGMSLGCFAVTVPASLLLPPTPEERAAFAIRVTADSDPAAADESARFSILAPSQGVRVLNPTANAPAPMAGGMMWVQWAASGMAPGAALTIAFRNVSATADAANALWSVASGVAGTVAACPFSAPVGVVCGSANITVPLDASGLAAFGRPTVWAARVSSSADGTVFGESAFFIVRPKDMTPPSPIRVAMPTPNDADKAAVMAMTPLTFTWSGGVSGNVKVDVRCVSVASGEMVVETIAASVAANAGSVSGSVSLASMATDVMSGCFVQLTPDAAGAAPARSAPFTLMVPMMGMRFTSPAPAASSVLDIATLGVVLSGSAQTVTWGVAPQSLASMLERVTVTMWRLAADGTPSRLGDIYPLAAADAAAWGINATGIMDNMMGLTGAMVPGTLPYGVYALTVSARVVGTSRLLSARSSAFVVKPADPRLTLIKPAPVGGAVVVAAGSPAPAMSPAASLAPGASPAAMVAAASPSAAAAAAMMSLVAGSLLDIEYRSFGVAASNRVRIALTAADGSERVISSQAEATGAFRWAIPAAFPAGTYVLTLRVVTDASTSISASSAPFAITAPPSYIAVMQPGALSVWRAGDSVWLNFTSLGFAADAVASIELWQERYFLDGKDRVLASLAATQPIMPGANSFMWTVPSDLPSDAPVYIKVTVQVAGSAKPWGRSRSFTLRSLPVRGPKEFFAAVCEGVTSAASPLPAFLLNGGISPAWKALCARTCDECMAWNGRWMPGAVVMHDLMVPNWPGGDADLTLLKAMLGAFTASPVNLCWPTRALNTTAVGDRMFRVMLPSLPMTNRTLMVETAGRLMFAPSSFTVAKMSAVMDTCAVRPASEIVASFPSLDPAALTPEQLAALEASIKAQLASVLQQYGVNSADMSFSIDAKVVSASGSVSVGRLLQASSGSSSSGSEVRVVSSTGDDSSAQGAADSSSGSSLSAPTGQSSSSVSGNSRPASSQLSGGSASAGMRSEPPAPAPGSLSDFRPTSGAGDASLSVGAYSEAYFSALTANAASRDAGTAAAASGPTPTPGPDGVVPGTSTANTGAIVGGVIGALVGIALIAFAAVVIYKHNMRMRGGSKVLLNNPAARATTDTSAIGGVNPMRKPGATV